MTWDWRLSATLTGILLAAAALIGLIVFLSSLIGFWPIYAGLVVLVIFGVGFFGSGE